MPLIETDRAATNASDHRGFATRGPANCVTRRQIQILHLLPLLRASPRLLAKKRRARRSSPGTQVISCELAAKPSLVGLIFRGKSRPTWEIVAHPGTDHLPRRDRDRGLLLGSRSSGVGGLAGGGAVHHDCLPSLPDRVRRGARAIKPGGP